MIKSKSKGIFSNFLLGKKNNLKRLYFFLPGFCKDNLYFKTQIVVVKLFYILDLIF